MDRTQAFIGGLRPEPLSRVQHVRDGHFVAGDGPGTHHQPIAGLHGQALNLASKQPGQAAHGFTLAAGAQHQQFVLVKEVGILDIDEDVIGQGQAFQ